MPDKKKAPVAAKKATPAPTLPKEARSFPPLALWLSKPENIAWLNMMNAHPVFIAACHYVENTVDVTPDDLVGAKAALPEVIVRKAAMAAGVRIFVKTLSALPGFQSRKGTETPEPWGHIQAPLR